MVIITRYFFLCLLCVLPVMLQGCAAKASAPSGTKIGLHIDAVLELVVEYPLQWKKDRRLAYGRNEGEIRWSHPQQDETLLQVTSHLRSLQTDEQALELALNKYPGLVATSREQVELSAGQAWHVTGQTAQQQLAMYLFLTQGRSYAIVLKTSPQDFAEYDSLLAEIADSFQILAQ